ncbi:MAG TPA: hypothetical protein VKF62_06965, partial [Planctomycetota bacterium]|nr:hypothetical protein [Planctomycetota bacterium]
MSRNSWWLLAAFSATGGGLTSQERPTPDGRSIRQAVPAPPPPLGDRAEDPEEVASPGIVRPSPPQLPLPAKPSIGEELRSGRLRLLRPEKVFTDRRGDGNIWAKGLTYKARFGSDGADYIPFLGSTAPRGFPLGLRFQTAAIGDSLLAVAQAIEPSIEGTRVSYDRGPVKEVYDLRPREVEQLFVVSTRPVAGDLVVRVGVVSEMAFGGSTDEGLRFEAPGGLGGAVYGKAVAIDAEGDVAELTTLLDGGTIEIRVPAPLVAAAAFPLTIDPVVVTFPIDLTGFDDFAPDVSYDLATDTWACVYEETDNAVDHDIFWTRVTDPGPPIAPVTTFMAYVDLGD